MNLFRKVFRPFRVVALLSVRNEQYYIGHCIRHLADQGLQVCVIDNESTDGTSEIISSFSTEIVLQHIRHPYAGFFDWTGILQIKQALSREVAADWFIHCDADEILEPPSRYRSLKDALRHVGRKGFNSVNFDEFVFVPGSETERWEGHDYTTGMSHYYYFSPGGQRLVRAWKNTRAPVDLVSSGGHKPAFRNQRIYKESFVLRHYIGLSLEQLVKKYYSRRFASHELSKGWHHNRAGLQTDKIRLPALSRLKHYQFNHQWDRSDPWQEHYFSANK